MMYKVLIHMEDNSEITLTFTSDETLEPFLNRFHMRQTTTSLNFIRVNADDTGEISYINVNKIVYYRISKC